MRPAFFYSLLPLQQNCKRFKYDLKYHGPVVFPKMWDRQYIDEDSNPHCRCHLIGLRIRQISDAYVGSYEDSSATNQI